MSDSLFTFEIQDASAGAPDTAADALERMREKIIEDTAALSQMNKALRSIKGSAHGSSDAFKQLKERVAVQKASIASAHLEYVKAGGSFKRVKKPVDDLGSGFGALEVLTSRLPRPFGALVTKLGAAKTATASGTVALGAAVGGYAALVVGVVAATVALAKYSIVAGDARRNERLQFEGLTKTRNWYGLAADSAGFLQSQVDKVSDSVALGRDKVSAMATSLYKANLRGGNLQLALEGVAIATAAAGEEQGQLYKNMILGGARAQGGIKAIVGDIKARFGGVAKAQMLSLGVQSEKLKENLSRIFAVPVEGFLKGLHQVTSLLSQQEATGRALHAIMRAVFGSTGDDAENAGFAVKRFFQGMTIGALRISIGFFRLRNMIRDTFSGKSFAGLITAQDLLMAGKVAAVGLGIAVAAVAIPIAIVGGMVVGMFKKIADVGRIAFFAFDLLTSGAKRAKKFIMGQQWGQLGKDIVLGIVTGLNPMPIVRKMMSLGKSAIAAFRKSIDSHSPSRKMAQASFTLPEGGVVGVKRGAPKFVASMRRMGDDAVAAFKGPTKKADLKIDSPTLNYKSKDSPRAAAPARTDASGASPAKASPQFTGPLVSIAHLEVNAKDKDTASSIAHAVREQLEEIVRQALTQMGAATT